MTGAGDAGPGAVDPRAAGRVLGSTPDDILVAALVAATAEAIRVDDEATHARRRRAMFAIADRLDRLAADLAAARAEAEAKDRRIAALEGENARLHRIIVRASSLNGVGSAIRWATSRDDQAIARAARTTGAPDA